MKRKAASERGAQITGVEAPEPSKKEKEVFGNLEMELLQQIPKAIKGHRSMEAYLLSWTVIEQFMLPNLLNFVSRSLKVNLPKKIDETQVSYVIKFYYLLSHDKELYDALEKARKRRNNLVHKMHSQESWKKIKTEFKKALREDIVKLISLFQDRFNGKTKIPVLTLYAKGWNDGLEKVIKELKSGSDQSS